MKIAIILLITVVEIWQLDIGVMGCNKFRAETNSENVVSIAKGKFKYYCDKVIGIGSTSVVYSGIDKDGNKVAVKETNESHLDRYKREYASYKEMDAIGDNKKGKKYGISPIFYANETERVLVMLKFDFTLESPQVQRKFTVKMGLQIMLELTITIKYMHWKGVVHRDIHRNNIMFILGQLYIIDYTEAEIYKETSIFSRSKESFYKSSRGTECTDLLKMFRTICEFLKIDTFMFSSTKSARFCNEKEKRKTTEDLIATNLISSEDVKPIIECACVAFEAFNLFQIPNYDKFYKILFDHLYPEGMEVLRYVYDWLTDEQKVAARNIPIIPITEIPNPKGKMIKI